MIAYLVLPVLVLACLLLAYVLAQDTRAVPNRLFALYMAVVALQDIISLIRLTTLDESLAWLTGAALAPLIAIDQWLLLWLVLALFLPRRYAQPAVRWALATPYVLALAVTLIDIVVAQGLWFGGVKATAQGTYALLLPTTLSPLLAALIVAQHVPIVILTAVIARHPERRAPAGILLAGCLLTAAMSALPQTRTVPVLYNLGPVPVYLAFAWVTLRYQLFRPTPVALEVALNHLPDGVLFLDGERRIRYANRAARQMLALSATTEMLPLEQTLRQAGFAAPQLEELLSSRRHRLQAAESGGVLEVSEAAIPGERVARRVLTLRDISQEVAREAALQAQNQAQARLLELVGELETPAIGVAQGVLLSPVVGHLDARRARELTARLLQAVSSQRTEHVILDLTGMRAVDLEVVQALTRTTEALRLMGCAVTVTGISAGTAARVADLGGAWRGVRIARTPEEALVVLARPRAIA